MSSLHFRTTNWKGPRVAAPNGRTAKTDLIECKRCGVLVAEAEYRRGQPSTWVSTGPEWVETPPIPVFQHGGPTACHPVPVGMVPTGYWTQGGYWTKEMSWAPGRPSNEEGCTACAQVVGEASAARAEAERARESSERVLEAVVHAAAVGFNASLDEPIEGYADAEVELARSDQRHGWLEAKVAAQDRRAGAPEGGARAAVSVVTPLPAIAEDSLREKARARARAEAEKARARARAEAEKARARARAETEKAHARARAEAEEERRHQRPVNENHKRYGSAKRLVAEHETLQRFCEATRPALHPLVLLMFVAAGVAGSVLLEQTHDWVPGLIDALRFSEEIRGALSVPLGAVFGVLVFAAASWMLALLHRSRVTRAWRRAALLRSRIGCGSEACTRCPRPASFPLASRTASLEVGGYLVLGAIGLAVYVGVTVGDSLVKLQRVGAVVPDRIRDDCRQRPRDGGPVELVCSGPRVATIGLTRVYFQFGNRNPSHRTYEEGIFTEAVAFRDCGPPRSHSQLSGEFAECGPTAAVWRDEDVVLGGAVGRRASQFVRVQHRYRGDRVYPR